MKAARRSSFLFSRVRNAQEAVSAIGADTFDEAPDAWERYVNRLSVQGIPAPGVSHGVRRKPATVADEQALYDVGPSFVDLLPWVEYLPGSECMLLDDGESVAAFFELTTIGTEGVTSKPHAVREARASGPHGLGAHLDVAGRKRSRRYS